MNNLKPLKWSGLIILFGIPTLLNLIACRFAIPFLDSQNFFPIEVTYFLSVGLLVLVPMFAGAIYLSAKEISSFRVKNIFIRMRIKNLSGIDIVWTVGGFIVLSLLSFLIAKFILPVLGMDAVPFFLKNMPLNDSYFWRIFMERIHTAATGTFK